MTAAKTGDTRWRVEWCYKLAWYDDGICIDQDSCLMRYKSFPTKEEAIAFATKIWREVAQHTNGIVEIDEMRFYSEDYKPGDPAPPEWHLVGDHSIIVSDDSGIPEVP